MRMAAALAMLAILAGCQPRAPLPERRGVASIDYCADQMVLGLLPREQIRAVSFEADSDASFSAPRAKGIARIRPQLEDIARLRPAVVVRSYGGAARLDRQLEKMGIRVVQLGFPNNFAETRADLLRVGTELGAVRRAQRLASDLEQQLAAAQHSAPANTPSVLYVTPGDVTTGPGSMVAEIVAAAGYTTYRKQPGWGTLPLEALVRRPPDVVMRAFFDSPRYRQDHWTASRHPVVERATQSVKDVEVPGAWISCGNWLAGRAVHALAAAEREQR